MYAQLDTYLHQNLNLQKRLSPPVAHCVVNKEEQAGVSVNKDSMNQSLSKG